MRNDREPSRVVVLGTVLAALCLAAPSAPVSSAGGEEVEDSVTIATGRDGSGRRVLRGTVLDYTGETLRMRETSGRESTVESSRVLDVRARRNTADEEGRRLMAQRRFELALERFREAIRQEQRGWMRREILSLIVCCYANQGQFAVAGDSFLILVKDDPSTPYFSRIPLSWSPHEPSVELRARAEGWLGDGQDATARLMGASWLLSSRSRREAADELRRLAGQADQRIAFLAEAQSWRTDVVNVDADGIERWTRTLERMPRSLRAGPGQVLGRALARHGRSEEAALMFLRAPLLRGDDHRLSADGLLAAAIELERLRREDQAIGLYRELTRDFSSTEAAAEAKQRMESLSSASADATED